MLRVHSLLVDVLARDLLEHRLGSVPSMDLRGLNRVTTRMVFVQNVPRNGPEILSRVDPVDLRALLPQADKFLFSDWLARKTIKWVAC